MWEPSSWYCTSMLRSIDSCQNRVSTDQYHLTISLAQVSLPLTLRVFWRYPVISYKFSIDRKLKYKWISLPCYNFIVWSKLQIYWRELRSFLESELRLWEGRCMKVRSGQNHDNKIAPQVNFNPTAANIMDMLCIFVITKQYFFQRVSNYF